MKQLKTSLLLFAFAASCLFHQRAAAQNDVPNSVLTNGGALISGSNNRIVATVGQPTAGVMSSANNIMRVGFWHVTTRTPNTPPGSNVVSQPVDPTTGSTPATITFANITQTGTTTLETSSTGPAPPVGFKLGTSPTSTNYYEITTTAAFSGAITVCINYTGVSFTGKESNLKLYHLEGGAWVNRKVSQDQVNNIICGSVTSLSPFAIFEPVAIEVVIDIKPGSFPNTINPNSNGVIPVAILSTHLAKGEALDFDATTVDPLSVAFGPSGAKESHNKGHIEDVDGDGDMDMMLHFKTPSTGIACGATSASLTGQTLNGDAIAGSDAIQTVGCGSSKTVAEAEASIPEQYALEQNYPNPFNPETEIRFAIPQASHVVVKIFNIVGAEIRTLVDEQREAGYHRVHWDGKDKTGKLVASGVYLYQLRAGNSSTGSERGFSQVKKMSLLR